MPENRFNQQLHMRRPDLENLPPLALPEGYAVRCYAPGDAAHWKQIIAASFGSEPEKCNFDVSMRKDPAFRPERVLFIVHAGAPVATASAYYRPLVMPAFGVIHMVGTLPGHQGKKLGYWVSVAALFQMRKDGRKGAWLSTDDFRLPAIKTYLNLGFEPLLVGEDQRERWRKIFEALGRPELSARFSAILAGPIWQEQTYPKDDFDYPTLVYQRCRQHPNRPSGRPELTECDAFADESFYKSSSLGTAGASIDSVPAGGNLPFTIWFRAGPVGLPEGTRVFFHTLGQNPLGTRPQSEDVNKIGEVQLTASSNAVVEPFRQGLGFQVVKGALREGDEIRLQVGGKNGFLWTPLAGRKELKVIVDSGRDDPLRRLPEPVVINVFPLEAERVEIILPATARPGSMVRASLSLRDKYDNRVPETREVAVSLPEGKTPVCLREGFGSINIKALSPNPLRVSATARGIKKAGCSNPSVPASDLQLFIGDLHAHDFTCPAEGYSAGVYRWALEDKRLDFISVAVQNHAHLDNDKWVINKHFAEAFLNEGRFVTFPAFEWQHSHYGDKVIHYLGGDQSYLPVDDGCYGHPAQLYEALRASDALVISHHSGYALDQHVPGTDWGAVETDVERLTELWSMHGSSEGYDSHDRPLSGKRREDGVMGALRQGLRIGFLAGSDTHSGRPGGSAKEPLPYWGGLAAVWAESLTRRAIFEALRARRTYALTGARVVLRFRVNDAWMGSELPFTNAAGIQIDAWAPGVIEKIELLKNTKPLKTFFPKSNECHLEHQDRLDGPAFYHCRVIQDDGELAVCSPVWIG